MNKTFLLNAFSLSMLQFPADLSVREITLDQAKEELVNFKSAVGHPDTATMIGDLLGATVVVDRINVSMLSGDKAVVAQFSGPRLPEGTRTLPKGSTFKWLLVEVH